MPKTPTTTPEQRIKAAKTVATKAINEAAKLLTDESKTRSTRSRAAYKVKADALDKIALVLAGRS